MTRAGKRPGHAWAASERPERSKPAGSHPAHARQAETHGATKEPRGAIAGIALLYESRDGKLCLFEDHEGHLTAVRSERLA